MCLLPRRTRGRREPQTLGAGQHRGQRRFLPVPSAPRKVQPHPGPSQDRGHQRLLFVLFLSMYPVTGLGSLRVVPATAAEPAPHPPYFLLANLEFVDVGFTSAALPRMLSDHVWGHRGIPYAGCLTQTTSSSGSLASTASC